MTDDLRRKLRHLDEPRRPTPAADARIRESIQRGIETLDTGHSDVIDESAVLVLDGTALTTARISEVPGRSRWLSYAAILLIGAGALAVAATRPGANDITTAPPPSAADEALGLQVANYCVGHVAPIADELELWNGTYYYLYADQSDEGGAIPAAISSAADELSSLGIDADETRRTIHRELDAMRRSGLAQRNVHLQEAIRTLASHLGTLPGSESCNLESLLAALNPPGGAFDN